MKEEGEEREKERRGERRRKRKENEKEKEKGKIEGGEGGEEEGDLNSADGDRSQSAVEESPVTPPSKIPSLSFLQNIKKEIYIIKKRRRRRGGEKGEGGQGAKLGVDQKGQLSTLLDRELRFLSHIIIKSIIINILLLLFIEKGRTLGPPCPCDAPTNKE